MEQPTQGSAQVMRGSRILGDCGCTSSKEDVNRSGSAVMPKSSALPNEQGETVQLTERELLIYQAGQSFGAAQALRQAAEMLNEWSQKLNLQAQNQATAGQRFLDRALEKKLGAVSVSGQVGVRLAQRVVKVVNALVGDSS
jgi:hypothetical protein